MKTINNYIGIIFLLTTIAILGCSSTPNVVATLDGNKTGTELKEGETLNWNHVRNYANNGNLKPDRRVEKTNAEWKKILPSDVYDITRLKGTERPNTGSCSVLEPGIYACVACKTDLFDNETKFVSGTGWPSFTEPIVNNRVQYQIDKKFGMERVEVMCNTCDSHLGHVFPDGPEPSGLRFCINSLALEKNAGATKEAKSTTTGGKETAVIGGGCFWCIEGILQQLDGIDEVVSGYAGGNTVDPTYYEVSAGNTGHAEVVKVTYDNSKISYKDLLRIFLTSHDPTTLNRQGADAGTQYRSVILYENPKQEAQTKEVIDELNPAYNNNIVTEVKKLTTFYPAEISHQDYYANNKNAPYCKMVIDPKIKKLKKQYADRLKK